ncbi:MAG: hypothetical protein H6767_01440 [Candidatus Peribacteria bacterium]|nr:MAG: hypothetical protein H6767_01440 [Candidatus Peribacteria bacterium]
MPTLYRATSDIDEQSYVIGKIKELINTPISSFSIKGGLENGASFSSKGSCPESSES